MQNFYSQVLYQVALAFAPVFYLKLQDGQAKNFGRGSGPAQASGQNIDALDRAIFSCQFF
jgi:hypothetical protein